MALGTLRCLVCVCACACALIGCASTADTGKLLTAGGVTVMGIGVLAYAGAFGEHCNDVHAEPGQQAQSSCPVDGSSNKTSAGVVIGLGAVIATSGIIVWALGDGKHQDTTAKATALPVPNAPPPTAAALAEDPSTLRFVDEHAADDHSQAPKTESAPRTNMSVTSPGP